MEKSFLSALTWEEFKQALVKDPVILIPLGSLEVHGPQSPMGDYRITEKLAREVAQATNSITLPAIPFGYSEFFKDFPGTISLQPETLSRLFIDICSCLIDYGAKHLLFVNGHAQNVSIIEHVARKIKREKGLITACVTPFSFFTPGFIEKVYGEKADSLGHGSDPMNSLNLYLFPDEVNLKLTNNSKKLKLDDLEILSISEARYKGVIVNLFLDFKDITPNGVMGDPSLGSVEKGELLFKRILELTTSFVRRFKGINTYEISKTGRYE